MGDKHSKKDESGFSKGPEGAGGGHVPDLEASWDKFDGPIKRQVTAVVVGCGNRGQNYANFAVDFPSRMKVDQNASKIKVVQCDFCH